MSQAYQSPLHNVPFIPAERIARKANRLISDYFKINGSIPKPPIPVELILQGYLGYSLSYDFLEEKVGHGVLGAVLLEAQEVRLDVSLSEEEKEGRHNFTVGHEIGHLVLHVNLLKQTDFLLEPGTPSIVCRSRSYDPVEVQADKFSACLLMPEDMVREVWERELSAHGPLCLDDYESACRNRKPFAVGTLTIKTWDTFFGASDLEDLFRAVAARLAPHFRVSNQAMRIRLEKLGYFTRRTRQMALV